MYVIIFIDFLCNDNWSVFQIEITRLQKQEKVIYHQP